MNADDDPEGDDGRQKCDSNLNGRSHSAQTCEDELQSACSEAACENLLSADDVMGQANDDVMDHVCVTVRDDVMVA